MNKRTTQDRSRQDSAQSLSALQTPDTEITSDSWQKRVEQEKATRVSRSRPLAMLEYQPCVPTDRALHLLQGWHLLFFARADTMHIADLRTVLQQGTERDEQLIQCFKRVQAQYRQYAAQSSQTLSESVASQSVVAEIRYGSLSIAPGFWLPEEMEMGLFLLPATGTKLSLDALTLVEHCKPNTSQSLDVLLVSVPSPRTSAELAALRSAPGDGLQLEKHTITLSTIVDIAITAVDFVVVEAANAAVDAGVAADYFAVAGGHRPVSVEGIMRLNRDRVYDLGDAPSASQLLELRQQLLADFKKTGPDELL